MEWNCQTENDIDSSIEELRNLITTYHPPTLLTACCLENCFYTAEQYSKDNEAGNEVYAEYALSLLLSDSPDTFGKQSPDKEVITRFNELVTKIVSSSNFYFAMRDIGKENRSDIEKLSTRKLLESQRVRGHSFFHHYFDLALEIFSPHDQFLMDHFQFNADDLINTAHHIISALTDNAQLVARGALDSYSGFLVEPNDQISKQVLDVLSCQPGENSLFADFKGKKYWPSNPSIIFEKPIITTGDDYYCFVPQILNQRLIEITEELIKSADANYFKNNYKKKCETVLIDKTAEYFTSLLPGAEIKKNLFYPLEGSEGNTEVDLLVLYDDNIFLIECKAHSARADFQRGAPKALKTGLTRMVSSAFFQSTRAREHITNNDVPVFYNKSGEIKFKIENKQQLRNHYFLAVTLQSLGTLSTEMPSIRRMGLIQGKEWPWQVFINDLRVIAEILDSPSEFLLYLKRRIRLNDLDHIKTTDELNCLMCFMHTGLYFEGEEHEEAGMIMIGSYTGELNHYYYFDPESSIGRSAKKPRMNVYPELKRLIRLVEESKQPGHSRVGTLLLSQKGKSQKEVIDGLKREQKRLRQEGRSLIRILMVDEDKTAVVFRTLSKKLNNQLNSRKKQELLENLRQKGYQTIEVEITYRGKNLEKIEIKQ